MDGVPGDVDAVEISSSSAPGTRGTIGATGPRARRCSRTVNPRSLGRRQAARSRWPAQSSRTRRTSSREHLFVVGVGPSASRGMRSRPDGGDVCLNPRFSTSSPASTGSWLNAWVNYPLRCGVLAGSRGVAHCGKVCDGGGRCPPVQSENRAQRSESGAGCLFSLTKASGATACAANRSNPAGGTAHLCFCYLAELAASVGPCTGTSLQPKSVSSPFSAASIIPCMAGAVTGRGLA
jgi:hypothetical protein